MFLPKNGNKKEKMEDKGCGCLILLVLCMVFPTMIPAVIAGAITLAIFRCFSK
jgi:hypothetical protein